MLSWFITDLLTCFYLPSSLMGSSSWCMIDLSPSSWGRLQILVLWGCVYYSFQHFPALDVCSTCSVFQQRPRYVLVAVAAAAAIRPSCRSVVTYQTGSLLPGEGSLIVVMLMLSTGSLGKGWLSVEDWSTRLPSRAVAAAFILQLHLHEWVFPGQPWYCSQAIQCGVVYK